MELQTDTFNRLSLGIMERYRCTPKEAIEKLTSLQLHIHCGPAVAKSVPLQAALLTAINTGKRAFLGGVFIIVPSDMPCLLPWPAGNLQKAALALGARLMTEVDDTSPALLIGHDKIQQPNQWRIVCNNWQAGLLTDAVDSPFDCVGTIPTAGIFAGGLAVATLFFNQLGIRSESLEQDTGISLWRPDLPWLDPEAAGPAIEYLPANYWLLGLGHLGQAYAWNIGLLPYGAQKPLVFLQDADRIIEANQSAGLLSNPGDVSRFKTRVIAQWLEEIGFPTQITERWYSATTRRNADEPYLALCGFDNAASRSHLHLTGFDLIVETGLGNTLSTFDKIAMHTFPDAGKKPDEIWRKEQTTEINTAIEELLTQQLPKEKCGILAATIAGKSVSASFVGACSGSLSIAEILRGLHGGYRYDKVAFQLRDITDRIAVINQKIKYSIEQARNGFIAL